MRVKSEENKKVYKFKVLGVKFKNNLQFIKRYVELPFIDNVTEKDIFSTYVFGVVNKPIVKRVNSSNF